MIAAAAFGWFVLLERVFAPWMRRFSNSDEYVASGILLQKFILLLIAGFGVLMIAGGVVMLLTG